MKPQISKKDILIEARNDWDSRNAEQKAKFDAQYAEFNRNQNKIFDSVKSQVANALIGININLEIDVDTGFSMRQNSVRVCVKSNDHRVHAEDKALSWTWEVSRNEDGSINKQSSSWSGLNATTAAQVESLRQTVNALEALNGIDWNAVLTVTLPDWAEYITEKSSIGERPKFEADIRAAEIAELIGTNTLVKGSPSGNKGRGTAWYHIVSESPKQFKVAELAGYSVEEQHLRERGQTLAQAVEQAKKWAFGISKEKFINNILEKTITTMAYVTAPADELSVPGRNTDVRENQHNSEIKEKPSVLNEIAEAREAQRRAKAKGCESPVSDKKKTDPEL